MTLVDIFKEKLRTAYKKGADGNELHEIHNEMLTTLFDDEVERVYSELEKER